MWSGQIGGYSSRPFLGDWLSHLRACLIDTHTVNVTMQKEQILWKIRRLEMIFSRLFPVLLCLLQFVPDIFISSSTLNVLKEEILHSCWSKRQFLLCQAVPDKLNIFCFCFILLLTQPEWEYRAEGKFIALSIGIPHIRMQSWESEYLRSNFEKFKLRGRAINRKRGSGGKIEDCFRINDTIVI